MKFFKNMLILLISTTLYAYSVIPSGCNSISLLTANDIQSTSISNRSDAVDISNLSGTPDTNCPAVEYFIVTALPTATQGVLYMADGTTPVTRNQQLSVSEANGLKFDPVAGFVGNATFTYKVKDSVGTVSSNNATVTIPVTNAVGAKPTADDKTHTEAMSNQWGPTNILNLSGHDSDGNAVTEFQIKSLPTAAQGVLYMADGTTRVTLDQLLTLDEANGLKFDPKAGFVGNAIFTYVAIDGNGLKSNPATVTIPVANGAGGGGNIPTADDKTHTEAMSNQWGPTNILNLSGHDSDGNAVTEFQIKSLPTAAQGVLYMADGTTRVTLNQLLTLDEANGLKFDPKAGFVGNAIFTYVAIDGNGLKSNPATVTIPVADNAGGGEVIKPITDDRLNPKILNNLGATNITNLSGTDKDGNAVTKFIITQLPDANQGILYMADGTTPVTLNQELTLAEANGLKFDPKAGFIGDATFRYAAIDKDGVRGNIATVTIPVGNALNDDDKKPTADDKTNGRLDNTMGAVNIVNLTGTDKDGNAVTKFVITELPNPDHGILYMADGTTPVTLNQELTLEEANGLKFDPKDGFVGNATFRYASIDGNGVRGDNATVTIPVGNPVNGNIVANNDVGQATGNANPIHINVLANDRGVPAGAVVRLVDANGALTNRVVVAGEGVWTVNANNIVTFTPVAPFVGTPTAIQYVIQNGTNGGVTSNRATITISGTCVCEPYESSVDTFSTLGLFVMLLLSSLLGARVLRKEFS